MSRQELSGRVQTALGKVDPNDLGITLPHEHLLCDASFMFVEPSMASKKPLAYEPIRIENLEWIKRNQLNCLDNLRLWNEEHTISELLRFKREGGNTVVDMGNNGLGRDPLGLARISRATGIHIIMGAGYYVGTSHPPELSEKQLDVLIDEIITEITVGVGNTGIRAGVLGEIGCSYPLKENEIKVLRAVAHAQQTTGIPVNIHPGQSQTSPIELIDLHRDNGGDVKKTVMSHVGNRHGDNIDLTIELAATGCFIEYDSFGNAQNPIPLPDKTIYSLSDWQRIECITRLIEHGYLDQLLISHDVFNKTDLRRYGGFGYDHILTTIIPLMRMKDISDEEIHIMLVENPKRMLQFS